MNGGAREKKGDEGMARGIVSIGSYVPYYRIERKTIGAAWGRGALKGEKAVANTDEDSLTMGAEAAIKSLGNVGQDSIKALYFASNTPPYAEKSTASTIAAVCGLGEDIFTADLSGTTKAGANALKMALDGASGGNVIVTAADARAGQPKSDQEQLFGDAAAAAVVGDEKVAAELLDSFSVTTEIIDVWRNAGELYVNSGEGRFIMDKGYGAAMRRAVGGILKKSGRQASEFKKIVLSTPGMKDNESIAKKFGFTFAQVQDSFMLEVGDCGAAQPLLMLADAIENAEAGDLILLAAYGNGADAFIFRITGEVKNLSKKNTVRQTIGVKRLLESYTKYLSFRGQLAAAAGEPFRTFPSNAAYWREKGAILGLCGSKCKKCGTGIFPVNRICPKCLSKDEYVAVRLAERTAKVFTYSLDALAGSSDDPLAVQTVADDDEGFRYYLIMTDFDRQQIAVGMPVEFTFRKMYVGGGYINYYWKCRPAKRGNE
jgi:3-hydroxy-3-methylglutaryl CoA synthase